MLNAYANDNSEGAAFVIEIADMAAGIIVRQPDGYRFFAATEQYNLLDGSIFKTPKAAQKAADLMHKAAARDHRTAQRFGGLGSDRDGRTAAPTVHRTSSASRASSVGAVLSPGKARA